MFIILGILSPTRFTGAKGERMGHMRTPLVVGAGSLLGQYVYHLLETGSLGPVGTCSRRERYEGPFHFEEFFPMDLSDPDVLGKEFWGVRLKEVFLAAAMTDVEACERDPARAERINVAAPRIVAGTCAEANARLIYFSTDCVFDGSRTSVSEEDAPNPLGVYGRTRLEGERQVRAKLPTATIIRTCANFGWNRLEPRESFVTGIIDKLRWGEPVTLCTDQWVSPSYAPLVAAHAIELMKDPRGGLYHDACRSCLSVYDVGLEICRVFGFPVELLRETTMDEAYGAARRPARSCLEPGKLEDRLHIRMPSFHDCLVDMKDREGEAWVEPWIRLALTDAQDGALLKSYLKSCRAMLGFLKEVSKIKVPRARRLGPPAGKPGDPSRRTRGPSGHSRGREASLRRRRS